MKRFALFLLVCIIPLATGCPVSTPKQPVTFGKLGERQDNFQIKFDNELANYDCLMSGRTWTESSVSPANQPFQDQLTDLRNRRDQINERLKSLDVKTQENSKSLQKLDDDFYTDQDDLDKKILAANIERNDIGYQNSLLVGELARLKRLLRKTPVKQADQRTTLQNQITDTQGKLDKNAQRDLPNQNEIARLALESTQLTNRHSRSQLRLQNELAGIQTEQQTLNAELVTNQQSEPAIAAHLIQPPPTPTPTPKKKSARYNNSSNIPVNYGTCSAGENRTPTEAQKALARTVRDTIINQLIRFTDIQYLQFEQDIYLRRASASFLGDAIDLGGNLAATISNGERAKTIINASLIAFRGGRKSVNIHYFQEQTVDALISSMQSARNRVLLEMVTQINKKNVDEYPLDAALGDVIKYFYAGTLPRALQELKQNASQSAITTNETVLKEKGVDLKPTTDIGKIVSPGAFNILNDLARIFASKTSLDSEKTEALSRLQKIVEAIKNNQNLTGEIGKDPDLKKELDNLDPKSTDGLKLVNDLNNLRGDAVGIVSRDVSDSLDQIIIDKGTKPEGGK